MKEEQYIEDLKDIKDIMDRSSRFISLSGWSGISAGIFGLIGAYAAYVMVYTNEDYFAFRKAIITTENLTTLLLIAGLTLFLSIGTGIFFTTKEAKRRNQQLWDFQTKRVLINLGIPLVTGGLLCLMLLLQGYVGLIAPMTLIFYGLALVNVGKYTLSEIRTLGIIEIILGLIATHFIGAGLLFWAIGFGVAHIIYGILMQVKG